MGHDIETDQDFSYDWEEKCENCDGMVFFDHVARKMTHYSIDCGITIMKPDVDISVPYGVLIAWETKDG